MVYQSVTFCNYFICYNHHFNVYFANFFNDPYRFVSSRVLFVFMLFGMIWFLLGSSKIKNINMIIALISTCSLGILITWTGYNSLANNQFVETVGYKCCKVNYLYIIPLIVMAISNNTTASLKHIYNTRNNPIVTGIMKAFVSAIISVIYLFFVYSGFLYYSPGNFSISNERLVYTLHENSAIRFYRHRQVC